MVLASLCPSFNNQTGIQTPKHFTGLPIPDGKQSMTIKLKRTGQRLFTAHTGTLRPYVNIHTHRVTMVQAPGLLKLVVNKQSR